MVFCREMLQTPLALFQQKTNNFFLLFPDLTFFFFFFGISMGSSPAEAGLYLFAMVSNLTCSNIPVAGLFCRSCVHQ